MPESQRVLHHVDVAERARPIAPPAVIDDPAVRAMVQQEAARAHAQGLEEGRRLGRSEADAAAAVLAGAIGQAAQHALLASSALTDVLAGRLAGLAVDIASRVVGELDPADTGIVARVEQALRVVDDRPLVVQAHAEDVAALQPVCPPEVTVEAAHDLARGEARVTGRWADADLCWDAVWHSVREVLDVE